MAREQDPASEGDSMAGSLKKVRVHVAEEGDSLCLFRMGDKFTSRVCTRALQLPRQQQGSSAEQM